jgi:hypothetical protein
MHPGYYVMRTHTDTNTKELWKVVSRAILDKSAAETWKEVCEAEEKNKQHEFFIVEIK